MESRMYLQHSCQAARLYLQAPIRAIERVYKLTDESWQREPDYNSYMYHLLVNTYLNSVASYRDTEGYPFMDVYANIPVTIKGYRLPATEEHTEEVIDMPAENISVLLQGPPLYMRIYTSMVCAAYIKHRAITLAADSSDKRCVYEPLMQMFEKGWPIYVAGDGCIDLPRGCVSMRRRINPACIVTDTPLDS